MRPVADAAVAPGTPEAAQTGASPSLAAAMREGSQAAHRAAESSAFVRQVLDGEVSATSYLGYVERLHAVYTALEAALDARREHPDLGGLHDARLVRTPALTADVAHWRRVAGRAAGAESPASPATAAYVDRIRAAAHRPALLVAHHYTRYLGDLSGGQLLRHRLHRRFGDAAGLAFYDFAAIAQPGAYKRAYRDRLDRLPCSPDVRAAVVSEVCVAFDLNRDLLAELAPA